MKIVKIILVVTLVLSTSVFQTINAQQIPREVKREIRKQEQDIQAKEEMLMSGVSGLDRIKLRLAKLKKNKDTSREEIKKKERVVNSLERRLTKLDKEIGLMKKSLLTYKIRNKVNFEESKSAKKNEKAKNKVNSTANSEDLASREEELRIAREKLEADRKARELAYQEEQARLAKLDNEIKAEKDKKAKAEQEEKNKMLQEKQRKVNALEDEVSVNEEMLSSGKEGLEKIKSKLESAKKEGNLTQEDINRKQAVITNIEKRLSKIEQEIKDRKTEILNIKKGM